MTVPQVPCDFFCLKLEAPTTIGCARIFSVKPQEAVRCPSMSSTISWASSPDTVEYSGERDTHQLLRTEFVKGTAIAHVTIGNLVDVAAPHDGLLAIGMFGCAYRPKVLHRVLRWGPFILDPEHEPGGDDH